MECIEYWYRLNARSTRENTMPKIRWLLIVALLVLFGGSLLAFAGPGDSTTSFGFEVDLSPLDGTPGGYRVQVIFRDLASDEVLAAPRLVFLAGDPVSTESEIPGTGAVAALSAEVSKEGVATYELEVRAKGRVLSRHKATVALGG